MLCQTIKSFYDPDPKGFKKIEKKERERVGNKSTVLRF